MEIHGISWDLLGEVVVGDVIIPNQVGCHNPQNSSYVFPVMDSAKYG